MVIGYAPIAHLSSQVAKPLNVTGRLPWLYIIAAVKDKIVYVGETHDQEGLIIRLGSHFGAYSQSSLKKRAFDRAGVRLLRAPFLVVAARLPLGDAEGVEFLDGSVQSTRRSCEAVLHQLVTERFVLRHDGWAIVSEPSAAALTAPAPVVEACESIFAAFSNAMSFMVALVGNAPFHLVLLDPFPHEVDDTEEKFGDRLESIELTVLNFMLAKLQDSLGTDWWRQGMPETVRADCVLRREKDPGFSGAPPEAYLMFLDIKAIAKANWPLFGPLMEQISAKVGKDQATAWVQEINDLRNMWAHPIRRSFTPIDAAKKLMVRDLEKRCTAACRSET